jgi:hypothetical protein
VSRPLEVLILIALPASGKSEIRRYLDSLPPETLRDEFHLGPAIQLDDFPYVHFLRRIDESLEAAGRPRIFFGSPTKSFRDPRDWGTLIELLNEDFASLGNHTLPRPPSAAYYLFDRLDAARQRMGLHAELVRLNTRLRADLAMAVEPDADRIVKELRRAAAIPLEGRTVIIEIARGGAEGARMPLSPPHGYGAALARFSEEILRRAAVLYVWITPEESRRRNRERLDPGDPETVLHHGIPDEVMRQEYGSDDVDWLLSISETPDRIRIPSREGTFSVPLVRFDNRADRTSFLREDPSTWSENDLERLHVPLRTAFERLADLVRPREESRRP